MRYEVSRVLKQNLVMDLVYGNSANPGKILGRHFVNDGQVIAAYHPDAVAMSVCMEDGTEYAMDAVERLPVYAIFFPDREIFPYQIKMCFRDGNEFISHDPYNFEGQISRQEEEWFQAGIWNDSYKKMGAHVMTIDGVKGVYFAVWAPSARRVSIVGDFNFWNGMLCPMNKLEDSGIFELFLPGVPETFKYKYEIKLWNGEVKQKVDPCGRLNLRRSGDASIMIGDGHYEWNDDVWMKQRKDRFGFDQFMSIADYSRVKIHENMLQDNVDGLTHIMIGGADFEQHLTSWTDAGVYSLPMEHLSPDSLKEYIDHVHQRGQGVILKCDFGYYHDAPSGLSQFDGTSLYGFSDERKEYNDKYGMFRFCYTKEEVKGYLYSAMKMWLDEYHIDGFMFAQQSEILFPDWKVENEDIAYRKCSTAFFEQAYKMIKAYDSGVLLVGDAVNAGQQQEDILYGKRIFDCYKDERLNVGIISYLQADSDRKSGLFYNLTRPFQRAFITESLTTINEMREYPFSEECQRMVSTYILGLPGKKQARKYVNLQSDDYDYERHLLDILNRYDALQHAEYGAASFEWIDCTNPKSEVISFIRKSPSGENLLFLTNFGESERSNFMVGVPANVPYELVCDSSLTPITEHNNMYYPIRKNIDLRNYSISVSMNAFHTMIFAYKE